VTGNKKKGKSVSEMLSEFFREAAVLLLVFYPLEVARKGNGDLSITFILLVGTACIVLLMMGIVLEKMGGE
jgi:hypothetical protein